MNNVEHKIKDKIKKNLVKNGYVMNLQHKMNKSVGLSVFSTVKALTLS